MPSNAKTIFESNCADVDRLLEIHKDIAGDARGRKYGVEVLNKSAVILICAYWEAYVEDVVAEALAAIVTNTADSAQLPEKLRKIVAKLIKSDANELSPWALAGDGWKTVLSRNLDVAKRIYLTNWNTPKTPNIRELFSAALGLLDLPAAWYRPYLSSATASKKLNEFVVLRGEIAHRGKSEISVTKQTVNDAFAHVKELVQFTDEATNAHVKAATGKTFY